MEERNHAFPANELRICIDSYRDDIGGRLYNKMQKEAIPFHCFSEMLLKADALFDACGYPQAFQEKRDFESFADVEKTVKSFEAPRERLDNEEMGRQHGRIKTIDILIKSRRRTSWQGYMLPHGEGRMVPFQSEMELLECITEELKRDETARDE